MSENAPETPAATPAAEALAEEHGVDLAAVEPSGASGNVLVSDVKDHVAAQEEAAVVAPENPLAFPEQTAPLTYAKQPETPEQAARLPEILKAFEMSHPSNPLPLEWLVESLKRLVHLDPPKAG